MGFNEPIGGDMRYLILLLTGLLIWIVGRSCISSTGLFIAGNNVKYGFTSGENLRFVLNRTTNCTFLK